MQYPFWSYSIVKDWCVLASSFLEENNMKEIKTSGALLL